jgi:hypothetical protein
MPPGDTPAFVALFRSNISNRQENTNFPLRAE